MIRSAVLIQYTRVTDVQTELAWHVRDSIYAVARKTEILNFEYSITVPLVSQMW